MTDSTEFAASYNRNFRKLGIDARCIISNDIKLQNKWKEDNKLRSESNSDILYEQVKSFDPDILWIENLTYLNDEWFSKVRRNIKSVKLIVAYHCAPYTSELLTKLKNADFIITCTPGMKDSFENEGLKTYLVYHAFDGDLLERIEKKDNTSYNNLLFSGSLITGGAFHNSRIELIESLISAKTDIALYVTLESTFRIQAKKLIYFTSVLLKKLKMGKITRMIPVFEHGRSSVKGYSIQLLRGNKGPLYGIRMYDLFNRSKIVLNIHVGVAGDYAGNMRMFEVTGVGSCLLTDNKKNIGDLFVPGKEVVVYDNTEDCVKKVNWLIENESERKEIARLGQERTLRMHTVENRCKTIISIIESNLAEKAQT
jgi:spore maturation protein CgeB